MLIQGDAAHLPLADGSVHCIITSPPYWGLRTYGVLPQVWGGSLDCSHRLPVGNAEGETYAGRKRWQHDGVSRQETPDEWVKAPTQKRGHPGALSTLVGTQTADLSKAAIDQGATCRLCGAWRGNLGLEPLHDCLAWAKGEPPCAACYVCHLRMVARELWRVLRADGTLWLNLGDSYAAKGGWSDNAGLDGMARGNTTRARNPSRNRVGNGLKPKDLIGVPWRVALALQADGWTLRSDIIWAKPNPMPESVRDRPTTAHEYIFLFVKQQRYFYDADAIREPQTGGAHSRGDEEGNTAYQEARESYYGWRSPELILPAGRNKRTVWTIPTQSFAGAHFSTFPEALVAPMVLAGTSAKGCCPRCKAQWERLVKIDKSQRVGKKSGGGNYGGISPAPGVRAMTGGFEPGRHYKTTQFGWQPTCRCDAGDPMPAIVLDPFCGSGTVGEVCRKLGREFVGIDLSLPYLHELALPRAEQQATAASIAQLPMFGEW